MEDLIRLRMPSNENRLRMPSKEKKGFLPREKKDCRTMCNGVDTTEKLPAARNYGGRGYRGRGRGSRGGDGRSGGDGRPICMVMTQEGMEEPTPVSTAEPNNSKRTK
jgi:hypothetical protein